MTDLDEQQLLRTVTRVANTLRTNDVPFALAGGCAVYALGGPATEHDVDVFLRESDATTARDLLVKEGMHRIDPPEDWLLKVYDDQCLVDLIFRPNQREVTDGLLARAVELRVGPTTAPVLPATLVMEDKLLVLNAHRCDYTPVLPIARALREQVDWEIVALRTAGSPYARAFLRLIRELGVIGPMREEKVMPEAAHGVPQQPAPQYHVARIQRALASDPRTSELGVQVQVRGQHVHVSGTVASEQRKAEVERVLHEQEPGLVVDNDVQVAGVGEPAGTEDLR